MAKTSPVRDRRRDDAHRSGYVGEDVEHHRSAFAERPTTSSARVRIIGEIDKISR
jgi:hypothetical protein